MIITNARLLTMEGQDFENGYIAFENGVVTALGDMAQAPAGGEVLDARGGWVLPGFVDAHTHIGVMVESYNIATEFINETTDPVTPHLRIIDGFNPFDTALPKALASGVTSAVVGPGSGNVIGGQMAAVKLHGERVDDMVILAPCSMKMALGDNPRNTYGPKGKSPMTRMGVAMVLREALMQAREYGQQKADGKQPPFNARWEAMAPVLSGQLPIHVHAHRSDDIHTAMRIAAEFGLRCVLVHCTDGHLNARHIKEAGIPAIVGPTMMSSTKQETHNISFKTPAQLVRSGVKVAITTDHDVISLEFLPVCAAMAVRQGLPVDDALRAITLAPAQIAGIDGRVGSLKVGKDADISVFSKHPFEYDARANAVFVDGQMVFGTKV